MSHLKNVAEALWPNEWVPSVRSIPFAKWYKKGKRGILFDVDNTLVPHGAPADDAARELFARLRQLGFRTLLVSNNKKARVEPFARAVGADYVSMACKPLSFGFRKGLKKLGLSAEQALFVGDQLFTDIYGAKRAGIYSILVNPIDPREDRHIIWKRKLERRILKRYLAEHGKNPARVMKENPSGEQDEEPGGEQDKEPGVMIKTKNPERRAGRKIRLKMGYRYNRIKRHGVRINGRALRGR